MAYTPGDNWIICDLSGKKVLMSQSRKTWDGLRVAKEFWYPRNPQDFLKAIPDHMAVIDGRPRPADRFVVRQFGWGAFCLTSPGGINYTVSIDDAGTLLVTQATWGDPQPAFYIGHYSIRVDDGGTLLIDDTTVVRSVSSWRLYSVNGIGFDITIDSGMILVSLVSVPTFMAGVTPRDGVFSLISPSGISYVIYIDDSPALLVVPGSWGPTSAEFYLGDYTLSVDDAGTIIVNDSSSKYIPTYRIVSPGGVEYMLSVDPSSGAIMINREGHWWDIPSLVYDKVQSPYLKPPVPATITEDGQEVWVAE